MKCTSLKDKTTLASCLLDIQKERLALWISECINKNTTPVFIWSCPACWIFHTRHSNMTDTAEFPQCKTISQSVQPMKLWRGKNKQEKWHICISFICLCYRSLLIQLLPRRTRAPPGPAASLFPPCISFQHADALGIPITVPTMHLCYGLQQSTEAGAQHARRSLNCGVVTITQIGFFFFYFQSQWSFSCSLHYFAAEKTSTSTFPESRFIGGVYQLAS